MKCRSAIRRCGGLLRLVYSIWGLRDNGEKLDAASRGADQGRGGVG